MSQRDRILNFTKSRPVQALVGLVFATVLWETSRRTLQIQPIFLPDVRDVGHRLLEFITTKRGIEEIAVSLRRVALGFMLSAAIGIPLAILFRKSSPLEKIISPLIEFIRYVPVICFVPISIYWLGLSEEQKIFVLVLGTFCQLVPMVHAALSEVPGDVIYVYTALHRGERGLVVNVLLPSAAPRIWESLRICLGIAWTYLIVAEVVGATSGLGFTIAQAQRFLQTDHLFAAMIIIGVIGIACDGVMKTVMRSLFPWYSQ